MLSIDIEDLLEDAQMNKSCSSASPKSREIPGGAPRTCGFT
jgi:hypothetical protein